MDIIKKTINFTSNVKYPLTLQINQCTPFGKKYHYPSEFGQEKYICALEIFIWNTLVCWFMAIL